METIWNISNLLIRSSEPVSAALDRISKNMRQIIFCVDSNGVLEGALTEGDFRRWAYAEGVADLSKPAIGAANTNPKY